MAVTQQCVVSLAIVHVNLPAGHRLRHSVRADDHVVWSLEDVGAGVVLMQSPPKEQTCKWTSNPNPFVPTDHVLSMTLPGGNEKASWRVDVIDSNGTPVQVARDCKFVGEGNYSSSIEVRVP
jgi:hypothetical protein